MCGKLISESTNCYAIWGQIKNFTEDLWEFNVPLSKEGYLYKSCVRNLENHRRMKENLEMSAEEIKGLLRTSLKKAVNIVDEGSSIYCPVIAAVISHKRPPTIFSYFKNYILVDVNQMYP